MYDFFFLRDQISFCYCEGKIEYFLSMKESEDKMIHFCKTKQTKALYVYISSVQSLSCVQLFVTPWTKAHQPSLSITNSQSLLELMSIKLVMPCNHLILCCPLLMPLIFQGLF